MGWIRTYARALDTPPLQDSPRVSESDWTGVGDIRPRRVPEEAAPDIEGHKLGLLKRRAEVRDRRWGVNLKRRGNLRALETRAWKDSSSAGGGCAWGGDARTLEL
jgi:hypothetical protein